jgi:hypothetical protein
MPSASTRLLTWELHMEDLDKLHKSASRLGNVKSLTVVALTERTSFFYRELVGRFLDNVSLLWPGLNELTLGGNCHYQNLSFMSTLRYLHTFSFDGFSSCSPNELASVLAGLPKLQGLSVVSQYSMLTPTEHLRSCFTSKRQSFTPDVLRSIGHLTFFSVTEHDSEGPDYPALFFTAEMVHALHRQSALHSLTINLSTAPDADILGALAEFTEKSPITQLELNWPNLDFQIFQTYSFWPRYLKQFWCHVSSLTVAHGILSIIYESVEAADLSFLSKVVLVCPAKMGGRRGGTVSRPKTSYLH